MKKILTQHLKFAILLFAVICSSHSGFSQSKKAPDWVWSTPVHGNTYYGVGIAKLDQDNYRLSARKMALREIVEKIFVSINSTSALSLDYSDEEIEYKLKEQIDLASSSLLLGHEKMDDWIDKKTESYYVLFRLDRDIYEKERDLHFEEILKNIEIIQGDAEFLLNSGELTSAILKTSKSLKILNEELSIMLEPKYENALNSKRQELLIELESQLRRVQFKHNATYVFDVEDPEPLTISQLAYDKVSQEVLHKLPIKLITHHGDVFWYEFTDYIDGDQLKIYGLFPENKYAKIQLEVDFPIPHDVKRDLDPSIWESLKSNVITVTFKSYAINVISKNTPNKYIDKSYLRDYLVYIFEDLGIHQPAPGEIPLMEMEINSTNTVRKSYNHYSATIMGDVQIRDYAFNKTLFSYKFQPGISSAPRVQVANNDAMRKLIDQNAPNYLEDYLKFLCSKHGSRRLAGD